MDFKKQLKTAYDADASGRDEKSKQRDDWKQKVRTQFSELLKQENKQTVLELGAGPGYDSQYFQNEGFDVLATDLSEEMIKRCKEKGLQAEVCDLYNLSSLHKTFDGIYSINVLLHVPKKDLGRVLENISKALNRNGIFYYGVYGGIDEERVTVNKTKMNLPRFFSFLSDKTIQDIAQKHFNIISFETLDVAQNDKLHFQSLLLRKK